jgi:hypothetical protein
VLAGELAKVFFDPGTKRLIRSVVLIKKELLGLGDLISLIIFQKEILWTFLMKDSPEFFPFFLANLDNLLVPDFTPFFVD